MLCLCTINLIVLIRVRETWPVHSCEVHVCDTNVTERSGSTKCKQLRQAESDKPLPVLFKFCDYKYANKSKKKTDMQSFNLFIILAIEQGEN